MLPRLLGLLRLLGLAAFAAANKSDFRKTIDHDVLLEVYASSIQFITVVIPPHNRELMITLSHSVNVGVAALI
jgi:hypothetical protein